MQKHLNNLLFSTVFLLFAVIVQAQTPFWSETFSSGIPTGWTNVDASNQNIIWKWCADNTSNCAPVFVGQEAFNATTAATGFVHVNSDEPAHTLPTNHISRLTTTAINCTGKSQVFLSCQSHIGTYANPAKDNAILRVSINGTTWQNFTLFPNMSANEEFSVNPYFSIVDISSVAANKATVYLQWQWTGNYEYMWDLDDVGLYDSDPGAKFDLTVDKFYYPVSSFATPASQISTDTFIFYAELSNNGSQEMTNVKLKASVINLADESVLFSDSTTVDAIAPGASDSIELDKLYAPELPVGAYGIVYEVSADSADVRPGDNADGSPFVVTNSVFSKENGPQFATLPADTIAWSVGNYYRMAKGVNDQYVATSADFAFATNPAQLAVTDVVANVDLFKVNDNVPENFSGFDNATGGNYPGSSLEWVGLSTYDAPDTVVNGLMQTVDLFDFNDPDKKGVPLVAGGRYFLVVSYPEAVKNTRHTFSSDIIYYLNYSTIVYTTRWYLAGFGPDLAAVLRMRISLATTTDDKPLPESALKVFPNPARDVVNLDVQFDQPTDATITIADIAGNVINIDDRQGMTKEQVTYNLPQLASGTYLARIATKQGSRTLKFIVQK